MLLAMHQTLVERGLCLREHTDKGPMLIFPSYYRRERPELTGHPAVIVPNGFRDDGTPVSLTFLGGLFEESKMLAVARAYQEATGFHLKHPVVPLTPPAPPPLSGFRSAGHGENENSSFRYPADSRLAKREPPTDL